MNKKVDELLEIIKHHNEMYRAGTPEVPDSVYDREVEMLYEMDPDNDWFKKIEPVKVRERRKSTLPVPMKSLNKVKDLFELKRWISNINLPPEGRLVVMPKFDGLSLLCNENTGEAWSRGGAENEGQDCTEHLFTSGALHDTYFPFTYGEFVFSVEKWTNSFTNKINPETGKPYKSPRNTAAGLLNRDEPSEDLFHVDFYRYGTDEETTNLYKTYTDLYLDLCEHFLQVSIFDVITSDKLSEEYLLNLYKEWRKQYYIDGLVIYVDDISQWKRLGRQQTSGNPLYAIAYKHPDFTDTFETTVLDINWKVSKAGALKPVVNIETVDTGDCEMNNPTGYNAAWIRDKRLAKGAKVIVTRSGGVIPKILETITPASNIAMMELWDELSICPHCGQPTAWNDNHVELCCTNPVCPGKRLAKIVFFYATYGAENIGEETLAKIYNAGYTTLKEILDITFDNLVKIDSFGEHMANIVLQNNSMIKTGVELPVLMQASDCFSGIGKIKAQQILDSLHPVTIAAIYKNLPPSEYAPSSQEIESMSKTMQSFWKGITNFYWFRLNNGLDPCPPKIIDVKQNGTCSGFSVCFSGVRDANLEEKIKIEGGTVVSGVSKKTTHLIVKDVNASSGKINKAKELGVKVINIEDFTQMV